jgi:hypothetical protein
MVYIKNEDEICSADSVLPDFKMPVSDILREKKLIHELTNFTN